MSTAGSPEGYESPSQLGLIFDRDEADLDLETDLDELDFTELDSLLARALASSDQADWDTDTSALPRPEPGIDLDATDLRVPIVRPDGQPFVADAVADD